MPYKCFKYESYYAIVDLDEKTDFLRVSLSRNQMIWMGVGADEQSQQWNRLENDGANFELTALPTGDCVACIGGIAVASLSLVNPLDPEYGPLRKRHEWEQRELARKQRQVRLNTIETELCRLGKDILYEPKLASLESENQLLRQVIQYVAQPVHLRVPAVASGAAGFQRSSASHWDAKAAGLHRESSSNSGAWRAASDDERPWIEVKSATPRRWYAVITKGHHHADEWVTKVSLSYAKSESEYELIDGCEDLPANWDRHTSRLYLFEPIISTAIRVHCIAYHGHPSLRLEAYFVSNAKSPPAQPPVNARAQRVRATAARHNSVG